MVAALQVKIDRKADEYLKRLAIKLKDLSPAMRDVGHEFVELSRLSFQEGRSPNGRPWAPLRFRSGQPLLDTGRLRNSLAFRAYKVSVEIGTAERYSGVHQRGATIRPRNAKRLVFQPRGFKHPIFARQVTIPARPFLPVGTLPREWGRTMVDVLQEHFGAGA